MDDTEILTAIESRLLDLSESWTSLDRFQLGNAITNMCEFIDKARYHKTDVEKQMEEVDKFYSEDHTQKETLTFLKKITNGR